ncbi:hypothetical protein PR202_gb22941 [Eleusine coracana subsp. coracana]|uniref:Micro-fibrillar-associated protein 1 C-terminal domain-containing protein n=1 Tax=Eleusine coracana subsp. coracana TaxID=191504 RepID=A0AAV5FH53_ELECO|nr:hypothetical protein PR202_gb22941 [Eleusine coracana subsp. coracana]
MVEIWSCILKWSFLIQKNKQRGGYNIKLRATPSQSSINQPPPRVLASQIQRKVSHVDGGWGERFRHGGARQAPRQDRSGQGQAILAGEGARLGGCPCRRSPRPPLCVAAVLDKALPLPGDRADAAAVGDDSRVVPDHRRLIQQAEVVSEVVPAVKNEEDEEERRRRIRERRLPVVVEEELLPREGDDGPVTDEEETEYETDSEEDEAVCIAVVKPVFVQKSQRDTIAERELILEEKRMLEELVKKRMEERKVETRRIVVEVIMEEEQIEKAHTKEAADTMDIDTDDELDAEEEYEAWKNREISRIREGREARLRQKGETKMMNLEGMDRKVPAQPKQRRKFLQRYDHRGAFFQDKPDDIYMRDFSEATGEDKMNRSILPETFANSVLHVLRSAIC